ncbi:DUF4232 domain-containing protein [Streptomyces sp. FT05W]|uniref:DUF4232 domain-containing protein n=1 Tax=Streptomyces TaxID=1883 RepID=UPI000D6F5149|nr:MULTISPECIES: DUF4232 domain-containing protein [Streptomyces]PWS53129.1 DUF4232 domain-containing protein [Streptomyces sp. FT05W]WKV79169.1 DUF4232 domain-containing protein [Streptomyces sp. SNU607]WSI18655.1 DUF4232 domain-containing protein [[Kitasatospora] papulosa]
MSTVRTRTTVLAAAATAVLALSLTACGDDATGTKSAGPAGSGSTAAAAAVKSAQNAGSTESDGASQATGDSDVAKTTGDSGSAKTTGGTKTAGATKTGDGGGVAACTTKGLAISAAVQDGPPTTHIVLTAKNTSGHSCLMQGFPEIRFLENARGTVPAVGKSKPAGPVVLAAGAPAYAVVRLSDGGMDEDVETVKDFSVTLPGNAGMAIVKAPGAEGIAVDPARWATGYWTPELRNGADEF